MRLVFCGTPEFAVPSLDALRSAGHDIALVVTQPDRPSGRGLELQPSPVKDFAQRHGLPVAQPDKIRNNPEFQVKLEEIRPETIVVVAYGRIIPDWMLSIPRHGTLNVHASLLPKYRGAAPIQWAVANGEIETGVTVIKIDSGLDTGDILSQTRVGISPDQTAVALFSVLAKAGAELLLRVLDDLDRGTARAVPQDNSTASLAPILRREDGRVDWSRTATEIYNRWRGFQPWPGAFTYLHGKKLVLHAIDLPPFDPVNPAQPSGTLVRDRDRLLAACGEGTWLNLKELQLEGKRRMLAQAFLNGISLTPGERLGELAWPLA